MKTEVLKQTANVAAAKKQVKEAMAALERISEEVSHTYLHVVVPTHNGA